MNQRKGDPEGPTQRKQRLIADSERPVLRVRVLIRALEFTRQRFARHGYEADAREGERLLLEIRALDPGFEEAT